MIEKTGDVVYPITAVIMGKQLYTASVSVVGSDGVVDALNLNFSELVDLIEDLLAIQLIHVAVDRYMTSPIYTNQHDQMHNPAAHVPRLIEEEDTFPPFVFLLV